MKEFNIGDLLSLRNGKGSIAKKTVESGDIPIHGSRGIEGYTDESLYEEPVIVIARVGKYAGSVHMTNSKSWVTDNAIVVESIDDSKITEKFAFYLLKELDLNRYTGGSAQSLLTQTSVKSINVKIPNVRTQKKIVSLLDSIDRKINLNCELAELLEETTHAIYLSKFSDSEAQVSLEQLGKFVNGYSFDQDKVSDIGRPIIKIKELNNQISDSSDRYPAEHVNEDVEEYELESGDILLSWSATLDVFLWKQNRGLLNQHIFRVDPNDEYSRVFIYHSIKSKINEIRARASGTTTVHINRDDLGEILVPVGENNQVREFTKQTNDMFNEVISLHKENQRLMELRDYLLPQLLSGEVVIQDNKDESLDESDDHTEE